LYSIMYVINYIKKLSFVRWVDAKLLLTQDGLLIIVYKSVD